MSFSLRSKYQPNSTTNTSLYSPEPVLPSSSSFGPYSENSHPASPNTVNDVLYQSRLTIKHQELVNRHKLCLTRLCEASREAEALRQENTTLRSVNRELNQHLRLMIQATVQKRVDSDNFATAPFPVVNGFGGLRIGDERAVGSAWDEVSSNRDESGGQTQARNLTRPRTRSPLSTTQKVHVCGRKKDGKQLELEVYDRGMLKTEVCNKWRETGACTYGDQCQFAHGIEELHPVIRHQYGHRCHFRHALTDQERLIGASLKNIAREARQLIGFRFCADTKAKMSSFEGVLVSDPWLQSQFTQVEFRGLKSKFIAIRNNATNRVKVADMPGTLVRMKTLHDMFEEHEIKQILQETFPDENEEIDFESFVRATLNLQNQAAAKAGTPRHGSSFLKAPTTTFHHIINTSEKHSYVAHINNYLADDDFLKDFLPIDPDTNDLFEIAKDGILLCKLINLAVPGTIDERAINIKKVLNPWERNENHTLCLNSAKAIGCTVVNIGTQDLVEARPHLLLGLISQIVKIQLLADLNIDKSPELVELIEDDSKDAEEELNKLSPEKVLLKWMNFHLKKAGYKKQVTNFSSDVKDGEAYAYLLTALAPETSSPSTLDVKDPDERAKLVLEQAEKLECTQYLTAKDIVDGSPNLNLAFVADIFQHSKKSARKKTKGSWDLIKACSRLRTAAKGKKRGYVHLILLAASVPIGLWSSLRLTNAANATRPMQLEWFLLAMSVVMGVTAISIMIRRGTWRPVSRTSPGKGKKFQ